MIQLSPFEEKDFDLFISWINDAALLFTIAGNDLLYPLDHPQLQSYLQKENSHAFTIIETAAGKSIGHVELQDIGQGIFKIDKLVIADPSMRGKGIGEQVTRLLTDHAFNNLQAAGVELYVFDWNQAAIRCYEKTGFVMDAGKEKNMTMGDKNWRAINMYIDRKTWHHPRE